jgi:seryl-tRNA synthetase
MLDIKMIVAETQSVKSNLKNQGFDTGEIDKVLGLDQKRKEFVSQTNQLRADINALSKQIGPLKKKGEDASALMAKVADAKKEMVSLDEKESAVIAELNGILAVMPNLTDERVPFGDGEDDNVELSRWGEPKKYDFEVKDHVALGEDLGMLDFEAATKVTGARFVFYKGQIARLERALINFMIDSHLDCGYTEIIPPFVVHERSMYGTGQLPKFSEEAFKLEGFDWYLVPTAEVPLTNIKREELFSKDELPLKMCAYTPCFRSEAGSHGKDTRGMIRQHQFNKVEMVNIVEASTSREAHELMIKRGKDLLESLGLPYREMELCTGDIGFGAQRTIDLEVWLPSQNKYREISSISNCGDFQARRAGIRYRNDEGRPEFAHTLNGSGLAVGRTVVAILENYQQVNGTILIPEVLRPYMGNKEIISN